MENNLEDKCLSGYAFKFQSQGEDRKMTGMTGRGGALMLIKAYREAGIPDEIIGDLIEVQTDQGLYTLNQVKVTKLEK